MCLPGTSPILPNKFNGVGTNHRSAPLRRSCHQDWLTDRNDREKNRISPSQLRKMAKTYKWTTERAEEKFHEGTEYTGDDEIVPRLWSV
jgi:hypothetical protein